MSNTLERLQKANDGRRHQAAQIAELVARARLEGCTWEQIGAALGVTRQAAQQAYGRVRVIGGDQ